MQNFTPFQNFADSCLKNYPFSWIREFEPPIEEIAPYFEHGIRFGWEGTGVKPPIAEPIQRNQDARSYVSQRYVPLFTHGK